jgi:hypothetical protein
MMKRIVVAFFCATALAAAAKPADPDEAEQAVPQFHMALLSGDFAGIYQRAAPALRARQTQAGFVAALQRQRAQLGGVRGADRTATKVHGREVTLTYKTVYEAGPAREEFVILHEAGQAPLLLRYRLLAPALK